MTRVPLLDIRSISLGFSTPSGVTTVVRDFSLSLERGEILALVGESGSGKTMVARAVMNLLPPGGVVLGGAIDLNGENVLALPAEKLREIRGARVGMVFQEPMVSLNPALRFGLQLAEGMRLHTGRSSAECRAACIRMLHRVRIADPEKCLAAYPHQFSGGMRQRIMLASAMLLRPGLLLADEPTSALDSIVQKEVLDTLVDVTRTFGTSVLLITHDLALAAQYADRVAVMYRGELKETGASRQVLRNPQHEYTRMLLESLPRSADRSERGEAPPARSITQATASNDPSSHPLAATSDPLDHPLVEADRISMDFPGIRRWPWRKRESVRVVAAVSLTIHRGETLAVVGESGSGKTTLGRALIRDLNITAGTLRYAGQDITSLSDAQLRPLRRKMQFVFQDPYASLNPRLRVGDIVAQGLRRTHGPSARRAVVAGKLEEVGLTPDHAHRFPHELSGGERQRVCIARALAIDPEFVVADEPLASLDVTVRAQVLKLFAALKARYGFTLLFISHDLAVVEQIADRVAVMYRGRIVELGPTSEIMRHPQHPYTRQLISVRPRLTRSSDGQYQLTQSTCAATRTSAACEA